MGEYSKLTEQEQRILQQYQQKSNSYSVNNSKKSIKTKDDSEEDSVYSHNYRTQSPLKILQTKIFNDSHVVLKPQQPIVIIKNKKRSSSTPKRKKNSSNTTLNSSKGSLKNKNSSRNNSSKRTKKPQQINSGGKTLDITKMPNWKYEINKLIRTVFRHAVLCQNFREDSARIGGLKVLDEYKKFTSG